MARFKPYPFDQDLMLPVRLCDQLLPGSFEYAVHHLVEERIDTSAFDRLYGNDALGAAAYPPGMLLKVVLYGYSQGLNSSRKLERACRNHVTFIALAAGHHPDHSTFAAFVGNAAELLPAVFADVLLVCAEEGLLGGTHFALDGLKLPANASKSYSGTFGDLEKKQDKLREKARVLLEEHKEKDRGGDRDPDPDGGPDRPAKAAEKLLEKADKIAAFLASNEPKLGAQGKEVQSNVTDNDSTKMKTSHGTVQGYNAQAMADSENQVIVWAAVSGEGQDGRQAGAALQGAAENLAYATGDTAALEGATFTADSNYHSLANLEACEAHGVDAYVPDPHFRTRDTRFDSRERHKRRARGELRERFTGGDFTYDAETDRYTCPEGRELRLAARESWSGGAAYRRYRACQDCTGCPQFERCLARPGGKKPPRRKTLSFLIPELGRSLTAEMRDKIDRPESRATYAMRQAVIEPPFGNIRYCKRLDRFHYRGKRKANGQWLLYCLVHDIGKIAALAPGYRKMAGETPDNAGHWARDAA